MRTIAFLRAGALACASAFACAALAQGLPQRLDDSASPRSRVAAPVVMSEQGRPLVDTLNAKFAFVNFGRVDYRLATARYVGHRARIYYVIPAVVPWLRSPSGLKVDWKPGARLAGGTARPGERRLVWSGLVQEPWFADSIELNWQVDLSQVDFSRQDRFGMESYFEIEVLR
jgi:hypothetical protein